MPLPTTDGDALSLTSLGADITRDAFLPPEQTVHSHVNKNLSLSALRFATSVASRYIYEVLQMVTPKAFTGFTCHFLDNGSRARVLASHELFHKTHPL
jgi:hypothetical protein